MEIYKLNDMKQALKKASFFYATKLTNSPKANKYDYFFNAVLPQKRDKLYNNKKLKINV